MAKEPLSDVGMANAVVNDNFKRLEVVRNQLRDKLQPLLYGDLEHVAMKWPGLPSFGVVGSAQVAPIDIMAIQKDLGELAHQFGKWRAAVERRQAIFPTATVKPGRGGH